MNFSTSRRPRQPLREAWSLERLVFERAIALGNSIAPSTHANYSSALNSYLEFCKLHSRAVQPTEDTMSFFVVFMSHHIQPRSVEKYLSGIATELEPHFPNARAVTTSPLVRRTLRGCLRRYSKPVNRKRALSLDDLQRVFDALHLSSTHDDLLFLAQLFTGFRALLRLGELVWPDNIDLQSYRAVSLRYTVSLGPDRYTYTLPSHKADPFSHGSTVLVAPPHQGPDAYAVFSRYLASQDARFPLKPELWLRNNGTIPTRSWFIRRLRQFFSTDIAGHSMRSGGATFLAATGMAPHLIQAAGRWSSDAWQTYVRDHPSLMHALCFSTS